jgi:hypothetical protein
MHPNRILSAECSAFKSGESREENTSSDGGVEGNFKDDHCGCAAMRDSLLGHQHKVCGKQFLHYLGCSDVRVQTTFQASEPQR